MSEPILHGYTNERDVFEDSTCWNPSAFLNSGNMNSTLTDVGRWVSALGTGALLPPSLFDDMMAPSTAGLGPLTAQRFLRVRNSSPRQLVHHKPIVRRIQRRRPVRHDIENHHRGLRDSGPDDRHRRQQRCADRQRHRGTPRARQSAECAVTTARSRGLRWVRVGEISRWCGNDSYRTVNRS